MTDIFTIILSAGSTFVLGVLSTLIILLGWKGFEEVTSIDYKMLALFLVIGGATFELIVFSSGTPDISMWSYSVVAVLVAAMAKIIRW